MTLLAWTVVLCACAVASGPVSCARILALTAHPAKSNAIFVHGVATALASAGHDVTVYSPFRPPPDCGFTHHLVVTEFAMQTDKKLSFDWLMKEVVSRSGFGGGMMPRVSIIKCDGFLQHEEVQKLLRSDNSYDVVITEPFFGDEPLLVFAHKFQAVSIGVMPLGPSPMLNWWSGNSLSLSHVPDFVAFPFDDRMTFQERLLNALSAATALLQHHWLTLPKLDHLEMLEFMDSATEGVVYCSLGSIISVETMPDEIIQGFVNVFGKIKQKVIWKIAGSALKGKNITDNVMISDWLPQKRVLGHRNTALFVTHGGVGSQFETLAAGVPVVGVPFFADQPYNVRLYERLGVGRALPLDQLAESTLFSAVSDLLTNASYHANAKRVSQIFKDLPMTPAQSVVYWVEYALRHRGAPHLTPTAAILPWHQRFLADLALTIVLAPLSAYFVLGRARRLLI